MDAGSVKVQDKRVATAGSHRLDVLRTAIRRGDVKPEVGKGIAEMAESCADLQHLHPSPLLDVDMGEQVHQTGELRLAVMAGLED